jgi:hypothetical protein
VLRRPHVRTIQLVGLSEWRKVLPAGLRLMVDVQGLYRANVPMPDPGEEKVYLPPMPRSSVFSIGLEHEDYGTVERMLLRLGGWLDPRFVLSQDDDHLNVGLGQPVKISGKVIGVVDEPIPGARIWLLLHEAGQALPPRPIRTDARGRYRLWFSWRPAVKRIPSPALLISAPGQLLHRDSLQDLCQWLTDKTDPKVTDKTGPKIDPKHLEGLNMAESRVIRLDRAFSLDWQAAGVRPSDRFFIRLPLPIKRKARKHVPSYLLPVAVDDRGRLQMPGDRLVRNDRGTLREKSRFDEHRRGLELYLLRDGLCELVTKVPSTKPMSQTRKLDLASRKSVFVQVTAGGRAVGDARFQVIRDLDVHPIHSRARAVADTGRFRVEIGDGDYWVLVESRHRGQGWLRIGNEARTKGQAQLELQSFRLLKVLTAHPAPDIALLPLRLAIANNIDGKVPNPVRWMLRINESVRPARVLDGVPESFVIQVSPWAKTMRINLREPGEKLGQFRPRQGRAHLGGELLEESPAELIWR